jgi:hypothetical protein
MSLFIGNVSKKVTLQEFEDAFKGFGNCKIDLRVQKSQYLEALCFCAIRKLAMRRGGQTVTPEYELQWTQAQYRMVEEFGEV